MNNSSASFFDKNTKSSATPAMEPSMESSALSQSDSVIASDDQTKKYVRWKEAEEKVMCELLKSQWEMEKVNSDTLTGTKFWPLISEKLKESGIDKTPAQCSRYWYAWARHRPEFKDTLQFTSRSNTPSASISNTGTDHTQSAQSLGVQTRLRSNTPAAMSKTAADNIPGASFNIVTENTTRAMSQVGSGKFSSTMSKIGTYNLPGVMFKTGQDNTSASMSQIDSDNAEGNYRWTDGETQKLRELVLAYRSSVLKNQQKVSDEFWTLISKQLETYNIHRTWAACRRRFARTSNNQVSPTKQVIELDSSNSLLPRLSGFQWDIGDDGDTTGYMEEDQDQEPSPRRGERRRMSRPPWTDEEHNRLVELLKARRELESKDESLEKLSNNKLFALVSKQLKQYLIEKSAGACTLYWSNKGFPRSGFDINSPALSQQGRDVRKSSVLPSLSAVGKDIAEAFSKLPQQHFDDSPIVKGFRKVCIPLIVQLCAERGHEANQSG
jgi:Myb-like DNA-binding domain